MVNKIEEVVSLKSNLSFVMFYLIVCVVSHYFMFFILKKFIHGWCLEKLL